MPKTLFEVVLSRVARMSVYLPKEIDKTDDFQETLQGSLFKSSSSSKAISKELIPRIAKAKTVLTTVVVDTWLENRAKRDYLKAK